MTNKTRSIKLIAMLVLMATSLAGTSKNGSGNRKHAFDGYYREVKYAQYFPGVTCYSSTYVWMPLADDEIDIGQEVWADAAMTVPFPNVRITSQYGSTYGTTFSVINGHIYDYSTVEPCYEP